MCFLNSVRPPPPHHSFNMPTATNSCKLITVPCSLVSHHSVTQMQHRLLKHAYLCMCVFTTIWASCVFEFEAFVVDASGPRTPLASCPTTSWRTSPSTPLQPQNLEVHHRQTEHASCSNAEPDCSFTVYCNMNHSQWLIVFTAELGSCSCNKFFRLTCLSV